MDPCFRLILSSGSVSNRLFAKKPPAGCRKRIVRARCSGEEGSRQRRSLLLGGLGAFTWLFHTSSDAVEAEPGVAPPKEAQEGDTLGNIKDIFANIDMTSTPVRKKLSNNPSSSISSPDLSALGDSLSSEEFLAAASLATSIGLGAAALKFKTELTNALEDIREKESELGESQASNDQLTVQNTSLSGKLKDARKTIDTQKQQIQTEKAEVVRLDGEIGKVKSDLDTSKADSKRTTKKLEGEKGELGKSLGEAKSSIESLKKKLVESQKVSNEKSLELERVQCELTGKLEEIDAATEKISKLKFQLQSMEETLVEEREKAAVLEDARASAVNDVRGLLAERRNLNFTLQEETQKVADLKATLQTRQDEISQLRPTVKETVSQLRSTTAKLASQEDEVTKLRTVQKENASKEKRLRRRLQDLATSLEDMKAAERTSKTKMESLQSDIDEHVQQIEMLQSDAMTMRAERDLLQAELELKSKEVEGARVREERLKGNVKVLERKLAANQRALAGVQNQLNLEQDKTEVLRWDLEKKQEDMDKAQQHADEIGTRLKRLELEAGRLAGVEEQLGIVTKEAEEVQGKLKAAERDSEEMRLAKSNLKEAEANLRAIREELSVAQSNSRGELRKVKMQLSESKDEVKELKKEIAMMQAKASDLAEALRVAKMNPPVLPPPPMPPVPAANGKLRNNKPPENDDPAFYKDAEWREKIKQELQSPIKDQVSNLSPNGDLERLLGKVAAARAVAGVRADAVMLLEEIENEAFSSITEARKQAASCEQAVVGALMKATAEGERADRLQKTVDDLKGQLAKSEDTIAHLRAQVTTQSARAQTAETKAARLSRQVARTSASRQ